MPAPPTARRRGLTRGGPIVAALVVLAVAWPTSIRELVVPPAVGPILGLAAALPVAAVVARPVAAWALSAGAAVVVALAVGPVPGHLWPVAVMHGIALSALLAATVLVARRWVALTATVVTALILGAGEVAGLSAVVAVAGVAVLVRSLIASRRRLAASEETTELERSRRAVLEERARIARDLHDVVAHSMSMIVVRSETAPYRRPGLGDEARAELAEIGAAARASLAEVRGLLGVLRTDEEEAPLDPQPGADDLERLLAVSRDAGMEIDVVHHGPVGNVGAAPGLSLHRILAESLANAARHAAGAPVTVLVDPGPTTVGLEVTHGPGEDAGPGSGLGLPGMRDRAAVVGGDLSVGPTPGGGWRVRAVLPRQVGVVEPG